MLVFMPELFACYRNLIIRIMTRQWPGCRCVNYNTPFYIMSTAFRQSCITAFKHYSRYFFYSKAWPRLMPSNGDEWCKQRLNANPAHVQLTQLCSALLSFGEWRCQIRKSAPHQPGTDSVIGSQSITRLPPLANSNDGTVKYSKTTAQPDNQSIEYNAGLCEPSYILEPNRSSI
jgi:hypothetical protein